jgi:hypothetical protein
MDRVALVGFLWFVFWTSAGSILGRILEMPGVLTVAGFLFALVSLFAWPWVLPSRLQDWMDE